jgi:serine/threonine protein kinase
LLSYQLISYHELVRATSNFSDDNLIGAGSFGKVFKGQLDDESFIAIKVLNMGHQLASKSFDTECCALEMARHRNLVKIISTCLNLDFKALILEYMPNGSIHDWLYSNNGCQLSFLQREYLHHLTSGRSKAKHWINSSPPSSNAEASPPARRTFRDVLLSWPAMADPAPKPVPELAAPPPPGWRGFPTG